MERKVSFQVEEAVEGLVHMSNMKNDYYEFNERGMMLIGRRTGEIFRIGEEIKVKLINVDVEQYNIDFEIVEEKKSKKKKTNNKNKKKKKKTKRSKKRDFQIRERNK